MRNLLTAFILFLTPAVALADTVTVETATGPVEITDASRIIALGGDVTEIIFALGAGDRVIATDTTSVYPAATAELPKVGYVRTVAVEGLLSLEPTLIIANGDAGPPATLDQIESIGIPVVRLGDDRSVDSIAWKIRTIGAALSLEDDAEVLAASVETRLDEVIVHNANDLSRLPVMFVLNAGNGAPMGAGRETRADTLITLAGGANVFSSFEGYRPLSPEAAIATAPQVLIMMDHTLAEIGGMEGLRAHPALGQTPAVRNGNVIAMDGLLLLGFGPRTPEAIAAVREGIDAARATN